MEQVGFIKFVNPSITFQTAVRFRIELALCSILLTLEEKKTFSRSNDEKKEKQRPNYTLTRSRPIKTKLVVNVNQTIYQRSIYPWKNRIQKRKQKSVNNDFRGKMSP